MSTGKEAIAKPGAAQAAVSEGSILDQAIKATKQTEQSRAQELLQTLTDEALKGTITWNKDVTRTINAGIKAIDAAISKQLAAIMHTPEFQKLEGTWRGLNYLVMNSETSAQLKIKVLNVSKRELFKDVDRAVEFDQSQIFKKLYENEFGMPGRRALRRPGRRLRVHQPSGRPRPAGEDVGRGGGGVLPVHFGGVPETVRLRELRRAGQAARSGEDLRHGRVHQVAVVPRLRGFPLRDAGDAAGALAAALRRQYEAGRRIRVRGGRARQAGQGEDRCRTTSMPG